MCACQDGKTCPACERDAEKYDGRDYDDERVSPWEPEDSRVLAD